MECICFLTERKNSGEMEAEPPIKKSEEPSKLKMKPTAEAHTSGK